MSQTAVDSPASGGTFYSLIDGNVTDEKDLSSFHKSPQTMGVYPLQ
jgi:hypothetical protein